MITLKPSWKYSCHVGNTMLPGWKYQQRVIGLGVGARSSSSYEITGEVYGERGWGGRTSHIKSLENNKSL